MEVLLSAPQFVGEVEVDAGAQGDESGAAEADRDAVGEDGLQSHRWDADQWTFQDKGHYTVRSQLPILTPTERTVTTTLTYGCP